MPATPWNLVRRRAGDGLIVALAVAAQIEIWVTPLEGPRPAMAGLALLWTLPLLLRRQLPLAAATTAIGAVTATSFLAPEAVSDSIVAFAIGITAGFAIGFWNEPRRALAGAIVLFIGASLISRNTGDSGAAIWVVALLLATVPGGIGQLLRRNEQRERRLRARTELLLVEREQQAQAAVSEERARIARELHDVVAHSISVMTIQAGAARLLIDGDPLRAEEPLLSIEETGRETLAELRRLLGVLRRDMSDDPLEPRPTITNVEQLVANVVEAGLPVSLAIEGAPRHLPPGLDLAAYRIVQEALTNVRKHAGPARAAVTVRYRRDALELTIDNDPAGAGTNGRAAPGGSPAIGIGGPGGHGIVGMRERVAVYGGSLEAGALPDGGFRVVALLPLEAVRT